MPAERAVCSTTQVTPTAFISGGSSGIGYGLAEALLHDGYSVTISSRRAAKLQRAAAILRRLGNVHHVAADVMDADQVTAALDAHHDRFGGLDLLVNNAGVGVAQPIDALTVRGIDLQLGVNVRSYMLATAAAMPMLRRSSAALIVNLSSVAGLRGRGGLAAYSASKAGVVAFTQALQEEVGAAGIKATAICPAFVDTPMAEWVAARIGHAALIQVADVVAVVRLLLRLSPACNVPVIALEPPAGSTYELSASDVFDVADNARAVG